MKDLAGLIPGVLLPAAPYEKVGGTGPSVSPERGPATGLCVRECHPLRPGLGPRECRSQLSADHHHVACSQAQKKKQALACRDVDRLCFTPPLVSQSGMEGE